MKPRTVIGVLFVVASLLKIGTLWARGSCISASSYYYAWAYI